jgi:effector-binding domain-containing protein
MHSQSAPTIREVKPINFLYFRTETTLNDLASFLPVSAELFREAVSHNLQITGPIHWHYFGFTGHPTQLFTLEVSLPVGDILPSYDGSFHFKRTENFRCVIMRHEGPWSELPDSYAKAMKFITDQQFEIIPVTREIYVNADLKHPDANITEVQVGIR